MNYNNDFSHDLEVGQIGEKALGEIFENKTIEVKTDLQAQKTGNVFVEYESRNKPSGITTTKADYWCFIISSKQVIIIETDYLKILARTYWTTQRILGGDSNTSKGILMPISALINTKFLTGESNEN